MHVFELELVIAELVSVFVGPLAVFLVENASTERLQVVVALVEHFVDHSIGF